MRWSWVRFPLGAPGYKALQLLYFQQLQGVLFFDKADAPMVHSSLQKDKSHDILQ